MILHSPFIIGSRLLPALTAGDVTISGEITCPRNAEGRTEYCFYFDAPAWRYEESTCKSGCQGGSLQEGFCSLLAFLGAFAEAAYWCERSHATSENLDLFPECMRTWAQENAEEISLLQVELEENKTLIEE